MLKVLAIGNSFSEDATAYLHSIAEIDGNESKIVNLSIEGASLETHWKNILADKADYDYQLNGDTKTGRKAAIHEVLIEEDWDVVVFQQVSHESGIDISYYPFIKSISTFVKKYAPNSQQYMHQLWAYEEDSSHEGFANYGNSQSNMQKQINMAVLGAARNIKSRIIPCGEIFTSLRMLPDFNREYGGQSLCRDGFHAHTVYGRYTLAATWYEVIFGGNILDNKFIPPQTDEVIDPKLIQTIKETVHAAITK